MKKISCFMEEVFCLTEASQDSPIWSEFMEQVDCIILGGLKNAFMAAIGSLLQRVLLYEQVYTCVHEYIPYCSFFDITSALLLHGQIKG